MDKKDYSTQLAEMLQEIQGAENPFMANERSGFFFGRPLTETEIECKIDNRY